MTKAELNACSAELQKFESDVAKLTQKAILLYNVLGKISNRIDEINQKCGSQIDWVEVQKLFTSYAKGVQ